MGLKQSPWATHPFLHNPGYQCEDDLEFQILPPHFLSAGWDFRCVPPSQARDTVSPGLHACYIPRPHTSPIFIIFVCLYLYVCTRLFMSACACGYKSMLLHVKASGQSLF